MQTGDGNQLPLKKRDCSEKHSSYTSFLFNRGLSWLSFFGFDYLTLLEAEL